MESTSLDDVLYRYASFRNLVDPITHDLIISLARYIHCPKPEGDALGAMEKLCRQLTYHLSPHSQWRRHRGLVKRKPQACKFPSVTWIDLGNNVDIFSLPQPFLLSLRKRSPKQGHLPTILELGEGPGSGDEARDETVGQEDPGGDQEGRETIGASQT
ncbi:Leucine-rich repeat-containing protein 75A, partial [Eschrichtius robustus]|nr:Leucine-rich repeat-containing protein 75A [Eschrichtius robustus]